MAKRKVFKKKATAKKARKKGQSVYKVKKGYSLSRRKRKGFALTGSVVDLTIFIVLSLCLFAGCATMTGCDEADYQKIDGYAESTQTVSVAAQEAVSGPAGALIPPAIQTPIALVLGLITTVSSWWLKKRGDGYKQAASELNYSINIFESKSSDGNVEMAEAKAAALNPATLKIIPKL